MELGRRRELSRRTLQRTTPNISLTDISNCENSCMSLTHNTTTFEIDSMHLLDNKSLSAPDCKHGSDMHLGWQNSSDFDGSNSLQWWTAIVAHNAAVHLFVKRMATTGLFESGKSNAFTFAPCQIICLLCVLTPA